MQNIKAGLIGIGLNTYWEQFDGLLDRLRSYQDSIKERITSYGHIAVIDGGMVDDIEKAIRIASLMKTQEVQILYIFISTYALSSTVLPIVNRLAIPVILLNVQPLPAIDYQKLDAMNDRGAMTGEWLANCQACSVPELASVFNRSSVKYDIVSGYLDDEEVWKEVAGWTTAVKIHAGMSTNKLGVLGNYYGGMVDVYSDLTLHSTVFGTHIEVLEMCELARFRQDTSPEEIKQK